MSTNINTGKDRKAVASNNNNLSFVYSDGAGAYFTSWKKMIDFWTPTYGSRSLAEEYIGSQAYGTILAGAEGAEGLPIVSADHAGILTAAEKEELFQKAIDYIMDRRVAYYQTEFDALVADLNQIAPSYDTMDSKLQCLRASAIIKKLVTVADDCLTAVSEVSGCEMVAEDGHYINTSALSEWYYNYNTYDNMDARVIDELAEDCLFNAMWEDKIVPMTEAEFMDFCFITEKTYGHANTDYTDFIGVDWETFDQWQNINWDILAEMAKTYNAE